MRLHPATSVALAALLLLLLPPAAPVDAQVGGTGLRIRVRDLAGAGVAGIAFTIVDDTGAVRAVRTDAQGDAEIGALPGASVRIRAARDAVGDALALDQNDLAGGLRIPLIAGRTQALDLRLDGALLFVEPIAEVIATPAPIDAQPLSTSAAAPAPTAGGSFLTIALALFGLLALLAALVWLWRIWHARGSAA